MKDDSDPVVECSLLIVLSLGGLAAMIYGGRVLGWIVLALKGVLR